MNMLSALFGMFSAATMGYCLGTGLYVLAAINALLVILNVCTMIYSARRAA